MVHQLMMEFYVSGAKAIRFASAQADFTQAGYAAAIVSSSWQSPGC
jgi:hypothetical protein